MLAKDCSKCKERKSLDQFYLRRDSKTSHRSHCKSCHSEYGRVNKKRISEYHKKMYIEKKEEIKERVKNNYIKNKSKKLLYQKTYRAQNKEKVKESAKKSYKKHKKKTNEKQKIYVRNKRKHDLNFKLKSALRSRMYKAIKGSYKKGSAVKDLGCTIKELKNYLESQFQPGMTWENWGIGHGKWQIDHIKPLASFDLTDRKRFLKACHYTNLQPLWYKDHIIKGVKDAG